MPFVSQMFGLVMEAESLAGSALAFRLCSLCRRKRAGGPGRGWLPGSEAGGSPQTDLGNVNVNQITDIY